MILEFKTVRSNLKELFEKEKLVEMGNQPVFENQEDYITSTFLEMDDVVDFAVGNVWFNGNTIECVYARLITDENTSNLIIDRRDFKKIIEYTKNCKIKTADEILNLISNENNPTGL